MKTMRTVSLLVLSCVLVAIHSETKAQSRIWINGYYASWMQGWHDQSGHYTSDKVDFSAMTHVTHFYLGVNGDQNGGNGAPVGNWLNNQQDSYGMDSVNTTAAITKAHAAGTKITFCVAAGSSGFATASSDANRTSFIRDIMKFLRTRGYDGVDLDWEMPVPSDTTLFRKLVNQLYDSLGTISPRPLLTEAAPPGAPYLAQYCWQKLDQINIMTYDLPNGAWQGWVTWPDCSIYSRDSLGNAYVLPSTGQPCPGAIDVVVDGFHNNGGIPYSKLGFGSDWYLYDWVGGVMTDGNGALRPRQSWITGPGVYGGHEGAEYYNFMNGTTISTIPLGVKTPGLQRVWDIGLQVPYWTLDNTGTANDHMVTLDDQQALRAKIDYAKSKGLGGMIVWEIGAGYRDDLPVGARDSMLQTLKYGLGPPEAPDVPTLSSPTNGATNVATNTSLLWHPSSGAASYRLQVSTDSTFATTSIDQSGIVDTSYSVGLNTGTKYFWHVNATNSAGTSSYSTRWSFTTSATPAPPLAPVLSSPANGAVNVSVNPALSWNASANATSYRLQVATDTSFSSLVVNQAGITATSYAVSGLSMATYYYWRVNATNSGGTSSYSTRWSFLSSDTTKPTISITSPANNVRLAGSVSVTATASDNVGVVGVQFKVDGNNLGPEVTSSPWTTSWVTTAYSNGVHTLTAVARDASGNTKTSAAVVDTIFNNVSDNWIYQDNSVGNWFVNGNGAGVTMQSTDRAYSGTYSLKMVVGQWTMPMFRTSDWSQNAVFLNPASYSMLEFYIYVTGNTSNLYFELQNDSVSMEWYGSGNPYSVMPGQWTRFQLPMSEISTGGHTFNVINILEGSTGVTWYIDDMRLVGAGGSVSPPSAPTLVSPSNGATGTSTNPILTWNASSGATSYGLQVSTSSSFSSTVVNQTGITTTSYAASGLASNTTYYWRVNAANTGGTSAYSTTWSFTTSGAAPSSPMLSSPSSGTMGVSITPTLSWNASTGATSYRLQVSTSSSFATTVVNQSGITATSYAISGLTGNTTYYWRVNATNASGTSAYSTAWSFTTSMSHGIVLSPGPNLISSVVMPRNSTLDTLLAKIVPHMGQYDVMKNSQGQVFWPALSVNQIGTWNYLEGYQISMQSADTLTVTGSEIVPEATSIPLPLQGAGVNIVPYLRHTPMRADSALAGIVSILVIAKNSAGQVFWPSQGVNQIGSMRPGQGYQVQVTQASTLIYPANTTSGPPSILGKQQEIVIDTDVPSLLHYLPRVTRTGANAVLLVEASELRDGDEIAAWTQTKMLVGSGVMSGRKALITVWGDNFATQHITDGAVEGEPLSLTFWSAAEQNEGLLTVSSLLDALTATKSTNAVCYKTDAVWIAQAAQVKELPKEFSLSQNYPNPFNPSTIIRYALPNDAMVTLEVFNILGQRVAVAINEEQKAGNHEVDFQSSTVGSGVYFYRLTAGKFTETKKMVIVR